jgi:hypothetical protein
MKSRYLLQKCKIRDGVFVTAKDLPEELDWEELCKKFASTGKREELIKLRVLKHGSYIGLINTRRGISNFIMALPDLSGRIDWILVKDPSFKDRVLEVYRVVQMDLDFVSVSEGSYHDSY